MTAFATSALSIVSVCLVLATHLSCPTEARPGVHNEDAEQKAHQEHMKRVASFRCKHPKPRAIPISHLIKNLQGDETFVPSMTVLHRCDEGAGCCPKEFICSPRYNHVVDVELIFSVTHEADNEARPRHFETIVAQNHTLCECVSLKDLPK